jgi:predicted O-methyltransferase YrrM
MIVADNTLWGGKVLESPARETDTAAIQAFNDYVRGNPELQSTLLPVRDGLHLVRKLSSN